MMGLYKYGTGLPFYRLARLQETLGVPVPESTQWELLRDGARLFRPLDAAPKINGFDGQQHPLLRSDVDHPSTTIEETDQSLHITCVRQAPFEAQAMTVRPLKNDTVAQRRSFP